MTALIFGSLPPVSEYSILLPEVETLHPSRARVLEALLVAHADER